MQIFRSNNAILANSTKDPVGHTSVGGESTRNEDIVPAGRLGDDVYESIRLPIRGGDRRTLIAFGRNCTVLIGSIIWMALSRHSQRVLKRTCN